MGRQCWGRWGAFLFLAILLSDCTGRSQPGPPNIVFITVDTLRADRLGCYGYAEASTPNIDALARRGALFEHAYTCIPRTTQAFASLFTSSYPHEHGALEIGGQVSRDALTLAEILKSHGYATMAVSANVAAGPKQGLDQGFQRFVDHGELKQRHRIWQDHPKPTPPFVGWAEAVTIEALRLLEDSDSSPFFIWLLYFDPHWRYDPPPPFNDAVDWGEFSFYREFRAFRPRNAITYFNLNGRSQAALPDVSKLYDAEVTYTDAMIGRFLEGIEKRPDAKNTLIVFTSDHGESLGEHGYYYEHGDFVYEPSMEIPLVFHWPGTIAQGRRVDAPVSILDVLPTVLELVGVSLPPETALSGIDLSSVTKGDSVISGEAAGGRVILGESASALLPQNPRRLIGGYRVTGKAHRYVRDGDWVVIQTDDPGPLALYNASDDPYLQRNVADLNPAILQRMKGLLNTTSVLGGRWRMAVDDRWKLIRIPEPERVRWELYDLQSDPGETKNLASVRPEELKRLRTVLETWVDSLPTEAGIPTEPGMPEYDRDLEERLRGLGYVD